MIYLNAYNEQLCHITNGIDTGYTNGYKYISFCLVTYRPIASTWIILKIFQKNLTTCLFIKFEVDQIEQQLLQAEIINNFTI